MLVININNMTKIIKSFSEMLFGPGSIVEGLPRQPTRMTGVVRRTDFGGGDIGRKSASMANRLNFFEIS